MPIVCTGQLTIVDVNDGAPGPALTITSTAQGFTFLDGVATPAQQFIGFQVVRYATTDPVQWYASNGATLITDLSLLPMAGYVMGIYGAGDGDIAYMSVAQFGGDQQVVVTAVAAQLTATITLMRLDSSTAAAGATVGATWGVDVAGTPENISTAGANPTVSLLNNGITISATGALSGGGGGQVMTIPVRDVVGDRSIDHPPSWYPVGVTKEFKAVAAFSGVTGGTYFTLETIIQYNDASGGAAYQYAYCGTSTFRRTGACAAASWSGAWVQDLDRNVYTGALNANYTTDTNELTDGAGLGATANATDGTVSRIAYPGGGTYGVSATVTGAIKVRLPVLWSSTMIQFSVEVYNYTTNTSFTALIGGYNYSAGSWINTSASIVGGATANLTVRFGHDGVKSCIWIGEVGTVWQYPQVTVKNLQLGYSNYTLAMWKAGWAVSVVTAFDTVLVTDADNLVHASDVLKVGGTLAATVRDNASTALANATTANTALANIASDSILSPSEKPSVAQDYAVIIAEQAGIDAQATAMAITTEKAAYDTAVTALTTYLGTLTGWNTVPGSDVAIVGTTFRTNFANVYTTRQALLNKIAAVAGTRADWSNIAGQANAPANNATRNDITYSATAPTAVEGSLWMDTSVSPNVLRIYSGASWRVAANNSTEIGGTGVNHCNPRYTVFNEAALPPTSYGQGVPTLDAAMGYFGSKSLKLTPTAVDNYCYLAANSAAYNITIQPNRKWIVSGYVRCALATKPGQLYFKAGGTYYSIAFTTGAANTWARYSGVVDLTANASTMALMRVDADGGVGADMWFDGLMVEPMVGLSTAPSPFVAPPNFLETYTGALNANYITNTSEITDGAGLGTKANSTDGEISFIARPLGGIYSGVGNATGAVKIALPVLWTNTMLQFSVDVYNYLTNTSFTALIGGYNHTTGWFHTSASIVGGSAANYTIRFGHDGVKACVWIGEINTLWQYPKVTVKNLQAGYSSYALGTWEAGWAVTLVTAFGTVTVVDSDNLVHASDVLKVGGTLAATVASGAANGASALTLVSDATTGLAQRMRANADNVLGGVLVANAVSAPAGLRVGSVTWDAAGTIIDGVGVAVTPKGIYARNASKTSFVLDAVTGDATFSGNLTGANITGATGTFSGSLTVETLGSMAQAPLTMTTSGSVTVPTGMTSVRYELIGGGGGGGGGGTAYVAGYGGGGGAGGYMSGTMTVTPGASLAYVIGGAGSGGANGATGSAGVASSLGGVVSAAGGAAGAGSASGFGVGGAAGASVPSGTSTAGSTAARVYDGLNTTFDGYGSFNGEAIFDGAGFPRFGVTGAGGSTPMGAGGSSVNTGVGAVGAGYGGGGGGGGGSLSTSVSAVGGAGRPGVVILTFFNANGVVLQTQFEALKLALTQQGIAVA